MNQNVHVIDTFGRVCVAEVNGKNRINKCPPEAGGSMAKAPLLASVFPNQHRHVSVPTGLKWAFSMAAPHAIASSLNRLHGRKDRQLGYTTRTPRSGSATDCTSCWIHGWQTSPASKRVRRYTDSSIAKQYGYGVVIGHPWESVAERKCYAGR